MKSHTKAFTPDSPLLAKYARVIRQDMIATNGDRDAIKTDIEWWQNEIKRQDILPIYKSMLTFRREIRRWLREAWLGETNNFNFQLDMSETISKEYRRGFRNGFRQFRPVSAITAEDDKLWEDQVRKDTNYLNELYNWVLLNDKASGGTWREVSKRGDKWLSRYDELFSLGQTAGARGKKLKWVINPAKESCVDCIRLAGRVYYADKWLEYDIRPQSARLACFGVFCGCKFVETDEPVTKGRPPKLVGSRR
ncbi:MAG: hypothetical protein HRU12_12620 [Phaeodactylibacter sp.]|nr:hypothetical protein [Phaeodactylibacter sp.]